MEAGPEEPVVASDEAREDDGAVVSLGFVEEEGRRGFEEPSLRGPVRVRPELTRCR